jgi:cobyrinic acid a,c-diamide synthase
MSAPGLLVAAPRSSSGKTTVTLGLLRALARSGVRVAGAKCGPDYIDPAFHAAATGRPSFNLDSWAMTEDLLVALAADASSDADLVVAEGLMGLFDGVPGEDGRTGSSADIAARFGWPVVLVLDVSGQSQSAAAVALGCARLDSRIRIGGVILNKVGSARHERLTRAAIESVGLPVLGVIVRDAGVVLPERHLGLKQARETEGLAAHLDRLADLIERSVDLARLRALAAGGPLSAASGAIAFPPPGSRIALADDDAFSFIYPHVLAGWRRAGAEIVPFSPLADEPPPAGCDACWLPGGYPELHAERLSRASRFMAGLRDFAGPVHGECGGYMVLGRSLEDADGRTWPMAGLLPVATSFAKRRMQLGYRIAHLTADGPLGKAGTVVRGHEFHYATVSGGRTGVPLAAASDAYGQALDPAGHREGRVSGSFFHAIAAGD